MYLLWTVSANNHVYRCTELKLSWSFQNFRYANKCVSSRLLQAPAWPARILLQRPAGAVNLLSMCGQGPAGRTKYACGHCRCHAGCLRTRLLTSWGLSKRSWWSIHPPLNHRQGVTLQSSPYLHILRELLAKLALSFMEAKGCIHVAADWTLLSFKKEMTWWHAP
jgi:hypothetical protein